MIRTGKHRNGATYVRGDLAARGAFGHVEGTGGNRLEALVALACVIDSTLADLEANLEVIDAEITKAMPPAKPERCAETVDMFGSKE